MGEGGDSLEIYPITVRRSVQEIITSQVVIKDRAQRDSLIEKRHREYGVPLTQCVANFIHAHACESVEIDVAEDRFHYLLQRIGDLNRTIGVRQPA